MIVKIITNKIYSHKQLQIKMIVIMIINQSESQIITN